MSLTDRADAGWLPPSDLITRSLVTHNAVIVRERSASKATRVQRSRPGRLDFVVNKMDMDIDIAALRADGRTANTCGCSIRPTSCG